MRLKIKLTLQKEVVNNAILQQAAMINYTVRNQQCESCQAAYATGTWQALVAVRQRVSHKRTFYFLEQLLLKHNAHTDCIKIVVRNRLHSLFLFKCMSTSMNVCINFDKTISCITGCDVLSNTAKTILH